MKANKYRPLANGALKLVRFKYRKRKVTGNTLQTPCVYLCRHRDMIGVIQAFADIKTVLRPWVLSCFCSYREAKAQLKNYTFSVRMRKSKPFCFFMSPICARILTSYVKSLRSIPVYRKEKASKSITTIKQSVKALEEKENIIIFVDVDYADVQQRENGEIYKGFYAIDKLYYRRNKQHVPFVPVFANSQETIIHNPVFFTDEDYNAVAFDKIAQGIYNRF